jgi:hypothetical protein
VQPRAERHVRVDLGVREPNGAAGRRDRYLQAALERRVSMSQGAEPLRL